MTGKKSGENDFESGEISREFPEKRTATAILAGVTVIIEGLEVLQATQNSKSIWNGLTGEEDYLFGTSVSMEISFPAGSSGKCLSMEKNAKHVMFTRLFMIHM